MGSVLIVVGAFIGYVVACKTYGRFLSKKLFALYDSKGLGGPVLRPLFGATNQLLACLALLVVTIYLKKNGKLIWYTLVPAAIMFVVTGFAMAYNISNFADQGAKSIHLLIISVIVIALELWMVVEAAMVPRRSTNSRRRTSLSDVPPWRQIEGSRTVRSSGLVLSLAVALAVAPTAHARTTRPGPEGPSRTRVFPAYLRDIKIVCRSMGVEVVELIGSPGYSRVFRTQGMKRPEEVLRKVTDDLHARLEWRSDGRVAIIHTPLPAARREAFLRRLQSDDSTVVAGAMREMARTNDLYLMEMVIRQVDVGDSRARQAALAIADARRLDEAWHLDGKRAHELTALILQSPSGRSAGQALYRLNGVRDPRLVELLLATLRRGGSPCYNYIISRLANIGGPRVRDGLSAALDDHDFEVREAVARNLIHAKLPDDEVLAMCRRALGDPLPRVRSEAASSLARFPVALALPLYEIALNDEHPGPRAEAIESLLVRRNADHVHLIARLAGDPSPYVRRHVARAFEWIPVESALPHLKSLIEDDDNKVRAAAQRALGSIRSRMAIEFFVARMKAPGTRSHAMDTLAKLNVDAVWRVLEKAAASDDEKMAAEALRTLAHGRGKPAERYLRFCLHDPRELVKNAALAGLFEIDASGAIDMAIESLKSKNQSLRKTAADYLGKRKTHQRKALLVRLARDEDSLVRIGSVLAISDMMDRDMMPILAEMASDKDVDVRTRVMGTMSRSIHIFDDEALDILSRGIKDVEPKVRFMAVFSLRRFDTDRALELMARVLEDEAENIAWDAAKHIAKKRSPRATALLLGALSNKHTRVRDAAYSALGSGHIKPTEEMRKLLLARLTAETDESLFKDLKRLLGYRFKNDEGVKEALAEEDRRRREARAERAKPPEPRGHPVAPRPLATEDDVF
jgi:HEAT repeat protein